MTLGAITPLSTHGFDATVHGDAVRFAGVLTMRNPSEIVTPFLREIHAAVIDAGLKELTVDLTMLRFMNSSSIRSLVDWVEWIRHEPETRRYVLSFRTKADVSWQNTTLSAIQVFGGEQVVIQRED